MCTGYSVERWIWMQDTIEHRDIDDKKPVKYRLAWFIGLYCAGILVTGIVVYLLRFLLGMN